MIRCCIAKTFTELSYDKEFVIKVRSFLCELQLMAPITEVVVVTGPAVGAAVRGVGVLTRV